MKNVTINICYEFSCSRALHFQPMMAQKVKCKDVHIYFAITHTNVKSGKFLKVFLEVHTRLRPLSREDS